MSDLVTAAVLHGPSNLMGAFKALVDKFGDDADWAADFVWKSARRTSKTAKWETVKLPGGDKLKLPPIHSLPPEQRKSVLDPNPVKPVNIQDAVDTVSYGLVPEIDARRLYAENFKDYHNLDENDKKSVVYSFINKMDDRANIPHLKMFEVGFENAFADVWRGFKTEELAAFKDELIAKMAKANTPDAAVTVFRELLFKTLFKSFYRSAKNRIDSGGRGWILEGSMHARRASVVGKYLSDIVQENPPCQ